MCYYRSFLIALTTSGKRVSHTAAAERGSRRTRGGTRPRCGGEEGRAGMVVAAAAGGERAGASRRRMLLLQIRQDIIIAGKMLCTATIYHTATTTMIIPILHIIPILRYHYFV